MIRPLSWAAGLFEGEGCIFLRKYGPHKTRLNSYLSLVSTDRDVVEDFLDTVGAGKITSRFPDYANKEQFIWRVFTLKEVEGVLDKISPWLGDRRLVKAIEVLSADTRRK